MCAAIWPSLSFDEGRLSGFWPVAASNSIGASASVICIIAFARFLNRDAQRTERAWYALLFGFCFVSLLASQTRNAMAGLAVGVFLVLVLEKRFRIGLVALGAIMARVIYVAVSLTSIPSLSQLPAVLFGPRIAEFLARSQTESQIEGLSSRMDWWGFAWQQFMHHPFTGLGAYAAGKFAVLGKLGVGTASQMHSDWMEVLAGTSLWGLIPFLVALVWCWVVLVRSWRDRSLPSDDRMLLTEVIAVLGVITLRSFFNVELSWHAPLLYFGVIGYAEFLRRKRKQRSQARSGSLSTLFPQ
jgi:O-antigen ligase